MKEVGNFGKMLLLIKKNLLIMFLYNIFLLCLVNYIMINTIKIVNYSLKSIL